MHNVHAQTIAVAHIATTGIYATPLISSKLAQLELVKLTKYTVLDEADMNELLPEKYSQNCYGKNCLIEMGNILNIPFVLSGSIEGIGNKIIVSLKLIDVKNKTVKTTHSIEFENQEAELQRMIGFVLQEMHGIAPAIEIKNQLVFKNQPIISNNLGKINNTGPRMGISFIHNSELSDFFQRTEAQGGLDIKPFMTNLGYQFEGQYIGTENFSALAEFIINVGGMEQGRVIPTFSFLNGFRFGPQGWEIAFGPSFGFKRTSKGYFDTQGNYITEQQNFFAWQNNPDNFDEYGNVINAYEANFNEYLDRRGNLKFNTNWLVGLGRTFKSGALNIPVNVYYSYNKYGGQIGASVGFNITQKKHLINK